ncbi:MAG: type III pantothenate kinase [Gammaproteobacteria bacterium]|nr:type III pantothenate kinase [Gammaproteobacteria bacterium]
MILLDCGNSQLKAQWQTAGQLQASYSCAYNQDWTQRLGLWLQQLPAKHCYFASVLDETRGARLEQCLKQKFDTAVTRFVSMPQALGVTNGYREPERLGVDRWMALIAASELVGGDVVIIDAGSAMTLDLLRADGKHLGGAILPGINTSLDVFKRIFEHIDFDDPAIAETTEPGCSTEEAIHINYTHNSIDLLPGLVNRWTSYFDNEATILLAGGDAVEVQSVLQMPARIVPDLVFLGMARLAAQ